MKSLPWKTTLALFAVYLALYFQWYWVWGVIFIIWSIQSLQSGETFLVETIRQKEHPKLFVFILFTWFVVSLFMILMDVIKLI